jgi:hypothetical protein
MLIHEKTEAKNSHAIVPVTGRWCSYLEGGSREDRQGRGKDGVK